MKFKCKSAIVLLLLAFGAAIVSCNTTRSRAEPFTVSHTSPQVRIGEVEVQFDTFLSIGGLRKQNVGVFYYPREDAVCLQYRIDFFTYNQFWSRTGRQMFVNALQQYNDDYNAQNLRRSGRTTQVYGRVQGFLIWQQLSFTVRARANMNLELGYGFKDRAPYFMINQREAEFIDPGSQDNYRVSPTIPMFLTRAQAASIAALFDQAFLSGLVTPSALDTIVIPDVYEEAITDTNTNNAEKDEY